MFVSGQIPLVPDTGELLGDDMQRATRQCIANAEAILRKAGLTLDHVVKASVFLTTMDDYADMDAAYRDAMPALTRLVKLWRSKPCPKAPASKSR